MDSVSSILMKLNDSDHSVIIHFALWVDQHHYVTYLEIPHFSLQLFIGI